jgi:hypothetical protein
VESLVVMGETGWTVNQGHEESLVRLVSLVPLALKASRVLLVRWVQLVVSNT